MCVCVYVYMCVCVCVCASMYVCTRTYVFMYVCMYVCMYIYICMHLSTYVCMYVCTYAAYVCMYICKNVCRLVGCSVTPVAPYIWQRCYLSCNFSARRSFLVHSGMLYHFITAKGRVQSHVNPRGIYVEKSGMGTDCSASTLAFQGQLFHP